MIGPTSSGCQVLWEGKYSCSERESIQLVLIVKLSQVFPAVADLVNCLPFSSSSVMHSSALPNILFMVCGEMCVKA